MEAQMSLCILKSDRSLAVVSLEILFTAVKKCTFNECLNTYSMFLWRNKKNINTSWMKRKHLLSDEAAA